MWLTFVFGLKAPLRPLLVQRQGCAAPLCSTNRSATAESTRQQLLRHSLTHWAIDPSKRTHSGRHLPLYFQNTFLSPSLSKKEKKRLDSLQHGGSGQHFVCVGICKGPHFKDGLYRVLYEMSLLHFRVVHAVQTRYIFIYTHTHRCFSGMKVCKRVTYCVVVLC